MRDRGADGAGSDLVFAISVSLGVKPLL